MNHSVSKIIKHSILVLFVLLLSSCDLSTTEPQDTTKPVITLTGEDTLYLEVGDSYLELGATCTDDINGTCTVVIDASEVQTTVEGEYEVTYNATDGSSNKANTITRTVIVKEEYIPTITRTGDQTVYVEVDTVYSDLGATCIDSYDIICDVVVNSTSIQMDIVGTYYVTYNAVDSLGVSAIEVSRTVIVQDVTSPEVALIGDETLYLDLSDEYIDLGAICIDNYDDLCTIVIDDSLVDMTTEGTYTVSYTATDQSDNTSEDVERTIVVQDKFGRVISVTSPDIVYLEVHDPWTNPTLYVPQTGQYNAILSGAVDPDTIGIYELEFEITDDDDNVYIIQLIIHVVDTIPTTKDVVNLENMYNLYPSVFNQIVEFDTNHDYLLDSTEIMNIVDLDISGLGIEYTYFIEPFTSIVTLDLSDNELHDVDFLADFNVLEELNVDNNYLRDADLCIFTGNTVLTTLNISNNIMEEIPCLNGLTSLITLISQNNYHSDLSGVSDLPALEYLDVRDNPLYDIDDILAYDTVVTLLLEGTYITDITNIDTLVSLETLSLPEGVEEFTVLEQLSHLAELRILSVNANLEETFFFSYLESVGVTVHLQSMVDISQTTPTIIIYDTEFSMTKGDVFDFNTIDALIFDVVDLYMEDVFVSSVVDTTTLEAGTHTITLTVTDSDGFSASVNIVLSVAEDYDLSNVVIFIRFADEDDFVAPQTYQYYEDLFNGTTNSLRDYYLEVSSGAYNINTILPSTELVFYVDSHDRGYYLPYDAVTNPIGYADEDEAYYREYDLLSGALDWLDSMNYIDDSLELDYNNDGEIDVITFLVSGHVGEWAELMWPHMYELYESTNFSGDFYNDAPGINGKYGYKYTFQLIGDGVEESSYFSLGVFAHEMFHIIGARDLYHYYSDDGIDAVENWGLMDATTDIPSHMLLYMKEYYGQWDQDDYGVSVDGTYTLNKSTSLTDNLIIIDLEYSNEYLYIEYRTQTGLYEASIPDDGVLIYRVDKDYEGDGNVDGYYNSSDEGIEEVYIFRPFTYNHSLYNNFGIYEIVDDGDVDAGMLQFAGNSQAGPTTNIPLFYSDGYEINISITIVAENADSVDILIDFLD